jgi:hypothetical protein
MAHTSQPYDNACTVLAGRPERTSNLLSVNATYSHGVATILANLSQKRWSKAVRGSCRHRVPAASEWLSRVYKQVPLSESLSLTIGWNIGDSHARKSAGLFHMSPCIAPKLPLGGAGVAALPPIPP